MDLNDCINEIVKSFSSNDSFDSHTVINQIFANEEYFLAYLKGYEGENSVAAYHSKIAKMIKKCEEVEECQDIKTFTIFGTIRPNKLWKKK